MLDQDCVVIDLETTETEVAEAAGTYPQLVEIGAVYLTRDLEITGTFESLVRPPVIDLFTPFCESLTGIKRTELEAALPWSGVWKRFAKFTNYRGCRILSWGADFDFPILRRTYAAAKVGYPHRQDCLDVRSIAFAVAVENGLDLKCLSNIHSACSRFEVEHGQRHRALPDAIAATYLLKRVLEFSSNIDYEGVVSI